LHGQSIDLQGMRVRGQYVLVPIDYDHHIQSDTPGAIPRSVLRQGGSDVSNTYRAVHPRYRMAEVSSVCTRIRLMPLRVMRLPRRLSRVVTQLPQVKLRLPEPDVNRRFDRCDDFRFSESDPERAEQRSNHGTVTLRLHSMSKQQARPSAIFLHCRAILSFDCRHAKTSLSMR
jgi:hypothetical protein